MLSLDFLDDVRRMNKRQLYYQVLNFGMIVSSALMIWKGLMVITGSESPIVVVLSGSMEPAFHRGDLLFLTNRVEDPIRVGEIVVFRIEGREIPIVHRVLKIHEKQNGHIKFLTKGDNNAVDDRGLYKQGQHWLEKKDVVGRARGTRYSFCWVCLCWSIVSKKSASLFPEDAVLCVTDVWSRYWSVIGGVASTHGGTSW
ncbi:signal peptidase complex catalytic subunit SEC11A isoform X3 [Pteropus alecto]|uniref:Signal peptidase complex catalytic subunit SEC11 n=1 Tax=Pteropus vampyrus TaxID=132908 RepID=A0A6P6BP00_PTEVA|nr:signal peptidase complex catalytic subunit SEC11A isoform X3 [Pteropus alecto]XP_023376770.1 signal peptidase complex catalytic subunit SEC11A isoform X3 [Pteropus vampyrus]XP_039714185.1 signal peptidase complex catalytic subunit SEC11A isoform X3 [Pteropus giganteus]